MTKLRTLHVENDNLDHALLHEMEQQVLKLQEVHYSELQGSEKAEVDEMLQCAVQMQDEKGMFPLAEDPIMPGDCYYYYVAKPTVILCAKMMESREEKYRSVIAKALDALCARRFYGHGYEGESERADNVRMLLEAGVLDYVSDEQLKCITAVVNEKDAELRCGKTSFGFGDWHKEAISLVSLWYKLHS